MLKILPLAIAISICPLAQKNSTSSITTNNNIGAAAYFFNFKISNPLDLFTPEKKTTEAWSQNWYDDAMKNIAASEYHFKWEEKQKAYCTPNRKNNLRFFYNDKGFTVEPRTTKIRIGDFEPMARPDEIKYKTLPNWKVKFDLDKKQVGKGIWQVTDNKAEYVTDKITLQYINNEEGMRQNFIVKKPLTDKEELKINLRIKTKLKTKLNGNQLQFFHKKINVLNYEDLKVWDANNKPLEASFKKNNKGSYSIQVNTKDAIYPITIDPISTTPAAILECNQANAAMGKSVSSAGDVNGDGYSDVIVGAYGFDNGQTDNGAAFVYHGSATGIVSTPSTAIMGNQAFELFGEFVASAGDVNGDGYSDVIVGALDYTNGQPNEGGAFVYHGSASGINTTVSAIVESNQTGAWMGFSVSSAGDVNGDGYSDVIVGAPEYDNGQTGEGAAFIYLGSAAGIITTPAAMVESNQAGASFGYSVASAGDVNGDGFSDVIVGAYLYDNGQTDEGVAFVYHGSATGINTSPVKMVESNQAGAHMGVSVASAGDVNGDGYSDVIVGAYGFDNGQTDEGAAFVYQGSATGINTTAAAMVESNQASAYMGNSVASAGDVNGDGYSDVIVGDPNYDNGQTDEGAAFVYQGSATGINTTAAAMVESNQASAYMGNSVASAGDVNGDGYSDVIVGAYYYDNGQTDEGAAFVYHGSAAGLNTSPVAVMESNQANAYLSYSVASAGDVNGDGYSDVIVGAYLYDNGQTDEGAAFVYHGSATGINTTAAAMVESNQASAYMGNSVASAGDVNGDGYSDVIVGAYYYTNGQSNEGAAFVYHGSVTGINTTAAATVESNQASAHLGYSVAVAGDVNGDGYSDVIVGAINYTNGQSNEGAALVYHGSPTGINTTAAVIAESNLAGAALGWSVASAGDVNGDGYCDVIVGAISYTNGQSNEGAAYVYFGSSIGINTAPAVILESNQINADMGWSVASAGDVNGDGYSDVIVGDPLFDNPLTDEGVAFVYFGSAAGINTTPSATLETNQGGEQFGVAVNCAGDVNGDGYSDVIVGANGYNNPQVDEGAAFIYYGSASGINTTNPSMVESNNAGAGMGSSVASAGDVDGDGYSDVIVGVPLLSNGQTNEGRAYIFGGNTQGANKRNNLRLYNANLTTPINNTNFGAGNFGAGLFAKSFLGRSKGKLVWETRLNYNPYSGTPITNSTFFTAQQVSYTDMGLAGIEIKNLIDKLLGAGKFTKLRARIKYDPVTAITGQVYSPWRNVSSIIDANNLGVLPIELISFKASWLQKGKTARLDFTTDKESGICCFDVEKSTDGFNYTAIGTIAARNAPGIQSYSFADNNASSKKQYYRIKIKGLAAQTDYSNIQQLQNNTATEILVFPNPTTNMLQLQLNAIYHKMNLQIVNAAGQTVKQLTVDASSQTITIPVQNLASGKYWLYLQSANEKQVLQFVKE